MSVTKVKICGITTAEALDAAAEAGAKFIGFVFYPESPRFIDAETAKALSNRTPSNLLNVGLFVNPKPADIFRVLESADLDMIQLHGDESPQEVQQIRGQTGLPVIKAVRVAGKGDLELVFSYEKVSDWLLFDAKSGKGPGGAGETFDWSLLKDLQLFKPWMLAGGLDAGNVGQALSVLEPDAVDVSSGVEDAPGQKNPVKIKEFIENVRSRG